MMTLLNTLLAVCLVAALVLIVMDGYYLVRDHRRADRGGDS